jgi:RNA polymerase sigma-70 factor (ECF subfamily)
MEATPALTAFVARLPPSASALAQAPDLAQRLGRLLDGARAAWPGVAISDERFCAFLAERVRSPDALDALCVPDLYLACACLQSDAAALAAFEAGPFAHASATLARFNAPASAVEDARQTTRELLFARGPEGSVLASYGGRGDLRGWLRVTLARELLRLIKADSRMARAETGELERVADAADDPETMYLRALYGDELRRALTDAMHALDARDRRLLRYSVIEQLNIDDVGALLGVHRTTAWRQLTAARERLVEHARELMKARLQVPSHELESVLRLVEGHVEVSLHGLIDR